MCLLVCENAKTSLLKQTTYYRRIADDHLVRKRKVGISSSLADEVCLIENVVNDDCAYCRSTLRLLIPANDPWAWAVSLVSTASVSSLQREHSRSSFRYRHPPNPSRPFGRVWQGRGDRLKLKLL